ncbi:hypothetical protein ABDK56_11140 [Sphingomonas sp. ASV193]|uniref:hypothetical protein n=1 Tax=Sphingomonas sp. ASV193 TaxID=3144405 RepID=UPI0032E8628F
MILLAAAAAMLVPPPLPGDDRTQIIYAVRHTLDALLAGDEKTAREGFDPDARFDIVDMRSGMTQRRTLDQMVAHLKTKSKYQEPFAIPNVLQNGRYAQVWVPYSFWIDGRKSHCGIDNATLVEGKDGWRITSFGFTMVALDQCDALGAPTVADPSNEHLP